MNLRRCAVLWMEPREMSHFEMEALLAGGTGVVSRMQWFAHAPHLPAPVELGPEEVILLGEVGPVDWLEATQLQRNHDVACITRLLDAGLMVSDDEAWAVQRSADERFRNQQWHGLSAVHHMAARWKGVNAVKEAVEEGLNTATGLRERHGPPPPMLHDVGDTSRRVSLPRVASTEFDSLLDKRSSCRNFDTTRDLPQGQFAQVLERVFAARGQAHAADDFDVLKKTSPSGGALHPTEAYLFVQHVEGIEPGIYHYRPLEHALDPLPWSGSGEDLNHLVELAVVGQHWFADAHVVVVLAPRFLRNFWKYRNHSKAYRVTILDVGHLSQTLFLSATEQGLGAFVTAAINEIDIEQMLGLIGFVDSPLAVCGFGIRADTMSTSELDPNHKIWGVPD